MPEENENEVGGEKNEEQSYTVENPSLDLEVRDIVVCNLLSILVRITQAYTNAYTGLAKLYRLQFISDHCPCYRVEALKLAIGSVVPTTSCLCNDLTIPFQLLQEHPQHCPVPEAAPQVG